MIKADKDRLYNDVWFLTHVDSPRNYLNLPSLEIVKSYIEKEFHACGLGVTRQKWQVDGWEYENVIASYRPGAKRRLIVGAHYDVCGDQPGADDNASGIAGLLETARLLALGEEKPEYGIDLIAYCLEEPPFFATEYMGSYIHAQCVALQKEHIVGMICYEMIGYYSEEPYSQPLPPIEISLTDFPDKADFILLVGIEKYREFNDQVLKLMALSQKIEVRKAIFPHESTRGALSDNRNYWHFGIPAVMINDTTLRNPHYHQKSDTIETLDFDKMSKVVDSCLNVILKIGTSST